MYKKKLYANKYLFSKIYPQQKRKTRTQTAAAAVANEAKTCLFMCTAKFA